MKKNNFVSLLIVAVLVLFSPLSAKEITLTILYDNYQHHPDTETDWGFACLIEGTEKNILFDTGTDGEILLKNAAVLGVDLKQIDCVVLSHIHRDHTGGLSAALKLKNNVSVYHPASFPENFKQEVRAVGAISVPVTKPVEICPKVWLTGEMGQEIVEQSLALETAEGLVVVTGCAHPGVVNIARRVKQIRSQPIELILGGFHLRRHSESKIKTIAQQLKALNVAQVGASHCTGDEAIALMKQMYAADFVELGTGRVLKFECKP